MSNQRRTQVSSPPNSRLNHTNFAAPILAGAVLLLVLALHTFALSMIAAPKTSQMLALGAPLLALLIAWFSSYRDQRNLADWLWASFIIAVVVVALSAHQSISLILPVSQIWGLCAALALVVSALFRGRICLYVTSGLSGAWVYFSYATDSGIIFLWPFLLVFAIGIALAISRKNALAATFFCGALLLWTLFSAQSAIALHAAGSSQIAFLSSLFLLCCAFLVPTTQNTPQMQWHQIILLISSALAASFAISTFATFGPFASLPPAQYLWWALAIGLLVLGCIGLLNAHAHTLDRIGVFALMVLLVLGMFALPFMSLPSWWHSLSAGILSLAGIWMAARALRAGNTRAALAGLGIWGAAVLLSSHGIEQTWMRAVVLAVYSVVAVGFYLSGETKNKTPA